MKKKHNLLDLEYISVESIKDDVYEKLFDKYDIKNFKDLQERIEDGLIKDKYLEEMIYERKKGIGIKLKDISTDNLKFDPIAKIILEELNINNFYELGVHISNGNLIDNMSLLNGFNTVAKIVSNNNKNKKNTR